MTIVEKIKEAVENGRPKETEKLIEEALEKKTEPALILEEALIPAMRDAGEYYRNNEGDIPRILSAARSMRKGLDILEPYLENRNSSPIGAVVLGTVKGDLHDVGKNLVAIMFRSAGFQVIDLGVDVSDREFLKTLREHPEVSLVCISSLLTTAMPEMRRVVKTIREAKDLSYVKIMVGGGSIDERFASEIGADAYTKTAVDAAERAKSFYIERS